MDLAMTKIKPEHKDRMMRIGVWPQFWAELVASIADGEPDKVAKRRLIAKYLGVRCGRPKAVWSICLLTEARTLNLGARRLRDGKRSWSARRKRRT